MKRIPILLAAVLAAGTLAACGSNDTKSTTAKSTATAKSTPTASASPSTTAGSHNAADVMFVQGMIPHHQQAIEMAALAASRASNPQVKKLAEQIRGAQDPEITTMKGWLRQWGQPTAMSSTGHDMGSMSGPTSSITGMMSGRQMSTLSGLSGKAFDQAFLTEMTVHHQGAIMMARQVQRNGKDSGVKQLAGNIVTGQTAEIATMANLLKQA
ncbi:MAG: DUF305 domain-containing protein [Frankiaceae bacterium]